MPRSQWKPRDQLTEFARLIQDYLWEQRPPISVAELAQRTGITPPTIWDWFYKDAIPKPSTLARVATGTGIPLMRLYEAAGYQPDVPGSASVVERIVDLLRNEPDIGEDARDRLIAEIRALGGAEASCAS